MFSQQHERIEKRMTKLCKHFHEGNCQSSCTFIHRCAVCFGLHSASQCVIAKKLSIDIQQAFQASHHSFDNRPHCMLCSHNKERKQFPSFIHYLDHMQGKNHKELVRSLLNEYALHQETHPKATRTSDMYKYYYQGHTSSEVAPLLFPTPTTNNSPHAKERKKFKSFCKFFITNSCSNKESCNFLHRCVICFGLHSSSQCKLASKLGIDLLQADRVAMANGVGMECLLCSHHHNHSIKKVFSHRSQYYEHLRSKPHNDVVSKLLSDFGIKDQEIDPSATPESRMFVIYAVFPHAIVSPILTDTSAAAAAAATATPIPTFAPPFPQRSQSLFDYTNHAMTHMAFIPHYLPRAISATPPAPLFPPFFPIQNFLQRNYHTDLNNNLLPSFESQQRFFRYNHIQFAMQSHYTDPESQFFLSYRFGTNNPIHSAFQLNRTNYMGNQNIPSVTHQANPFPLESSSLFQNPIQQHTFVKIPASPQTQFVRPSQQLNFQRNIAGEPAPSSSSQSSGLHPNSQRFFRLTDNPQNRSESSTFDNVSKETDDDTESHFYLPAELHNLLLG